MTAVVMYYDNQFAVCGTIIERLPFSIMPMEENKLKWN